MIAFANARNQNLNNNINKNICSKINKTSKKDKNKKLKEKIYKTKTCINHEGISMGAMKKVGKKIKINKIVKVNKNNCLSDNISRNKEMKEHIDKQHKKLNTQIYLTSLLKNFYIREKKGRKNNKSLYNFGNIFFINQTNLTKEEEFNKDKIIALNESKEQKNLNTLNYSIIKQKPQIINDFSNYKKKGKIINKLKNNFEDDIIKRNIDNELINKKANTDLNDNIKNNCNIKIKIKDSFKLQENHESLGEDAIMI